MKAALLASIFLFSLPASANNFIAATETEPLPHTTSGSELLKSFHDYLKPDSAEYFGTAYYMGFVVGTFDTAQGTLFCPPSGLTVGQMSLIVGKYLEANPERLHFSAARLALEAFAKTYPCKKGK